MAQKQFQKAHYVSSTNRIIATLSEIDQALDFLGSPIRTKPHIRGYQNNTTTHWLRISSRHVEEFPSSFHIPEREHGKLFGFSGYLQIFQTVLVLIPLIGLSNYELVKRRNRYLKTRETETHISVPDYECFFWDRTERDWLDGPPERTIRIPHVETSSIEDRSQPYDDLWFYEG